MIYFIIFYLKNEVNDNILKAIQGLHVELKITQKNYRELVMNSNLIVSYRLKTKCTLFQVKVPLTDLILSQQLNLKFNLGSSKLKPGQSIGTRWLPDAR